MGNHNADLFIIAWQTTTTIVRSRSIVIVDKLDLSHAGGSRIRGPCVRRRSRAIALAKFGVCADLITDDALKAALVEVSKLDPSRKGCNY